MGFFKNLFGQSDDDEQNNDYYDSLDYSDDDDDVEDYDDDDLDSSSYETPERYYSLAKVRVQGIEDLEDFDKEFVEEDLEEDMHVYLRNEFDNPKDCHALQVMHHNHIIGYIDKKKAEIVHSYLQNGDIGAIVVSKISSRDFKKIIELTIYYEDKNGEESLRNIGINSLILSCEL